MQQHKNCDNIWYIKTVTICSRVYTNYDYIMYCKIVTIFLVIDTIYFTITSYHILATQINNLATTQNTTSSTTHIFKYIYIYIKNLLTLSINISWDQSNVDGEHLQTNNRTPHLIADYISVGWNVLKKRSTPQLRHITHQYFVSIFVWSLE